MSEWHFDSARFVEEVLKPVQDGWRPDEDFFRVYLLPPDVTGADVVRTALAKIKSQLNNRQYGGFKRACDQLRALHETAVATLTDPAKSAAHRAAVSARTRKLGGGLQQRLRGAPGLSGQRVESLVRESGGALTRTTVLAALAEIGARQLEPVELPATPEPRQWSDTHHLLVQLQHASLWDYLAGTLNGTRTSERDLEARRSKLRVSRDAETTAEQTLLKRIQQWLGDASLIAVLRHELLSGLAAQVPYGYSEVAAAAEAVAERLVALELPADTGTTAYAAWCHFTDPASTAPAWQDDYRSAVRDLRLRTALAVLDGQPGLPDEWRERRSELAAQLTTLDTEIARCRQLERHDVEAAATGYYRIREQLSDHDLDVAIERCAPAAPPSATAVVQAGQVVVSWRPSRARAGRIGYRVTRGSTLICADTRDLEVADDDPPGGTPLSYEVRTTRDGTSSTRPARTAAVTVLRDVLDLVLRGEPHRIAGRWRLPAGASGAVVRRNGSAVRDVQSSTFEDTGVRAGRAYDYVVTATYRLADGTIAESDGVHASARCQEIPDAVTDLTAEADGDGLLVRWTAPAQGDVEILELRQNVDAPAQEVVPVSKARAYGVPVRSAPGAGRNWLRVELAASARRQKLLPVTVLGDLAAIGAPCAVDVRHGTVRSLRVDRLGPTVRLTWEWPPGATSARVVWRTGTKPTGPADPAASKLDVTRVTYDSRGVSVPAPAGDHWFGVCTSLVDGETRSFGPILFGQGSTPVAIRYSIERVRSLRRTRRILVVDGEPGSGVPPIVVVAKSGLRPLEASDGHELVTTEAGVAPMRVEFTVPPDLRRPLHIRAFSRDERVHMVAASPGQLVLT
ncbi:hypothetical protein [Amycolatopsis sp. WQ 127309]|uniref:hypothetical protein n=1 Tax=Amycolatopsis sp. WQ 127309 TaxID=2932773 RepID=UPI001FF258DB|nr:hypothetical protein [Amycolatopsis sp. WQ 127309]UOZ07939.1 hypothetical protein MUY22_06560 [Amycolatopsis sp. WQ 127309]